MKTAFISAALLAAAASTASAQLAFETGRIDASYFKYVGNSSVYTLMLNARAAYSIGQTGLQIDGSATSFIFAPAFSFDEYSVGVHAYKPLANGAKIGAYATADEIALFGNTYFGAGAEAMMRFGALDVEAAIGAMTISGSNSAFWIADIDTYYALTPSIELNVGALWFLSSSDPYYNLGVTYSLASLPVSIGASYVNRSGSESYGVTLSYTFGPKSEDRLFGTRQYPLYLN